MTKGRGNLSREFEEMVAIEDDGGVSDDEGRESSEVAFGVRLNDRQRIFVDRYLVHGNASLAAKEAGYAEAKGWAITGYRVKSNPKVQEALRHGWAERRRRFQVDEAVVHDLLMKTYWDACESKSYAAAVRALEMLGKSLGMLQDVNVNFNANRFVQVNDVSLAEKVLPIFEKLGIANGTAVTPDVLAGMLRERSGVSPKQIEGSVDDD